MERNKRPQLCKNILQKGFCYNPNCKFSHDVSQLEGFRNMDEYFVSETLRYELAMKRRSLLNPHGAGAQYSAVGSEIQVGKYHTVTQITQKQKQKIFGYNTCTYRGISSKDGKVHFMRRVDCFHIASVVPRSEAVVAWKGAFHGSIAKMIDVFTAPRFLNGEASPVFFVYEFYPSCVSLDNYIVGMMQNETKIIPETFIWSVASQLAMAMRHIHANGLSFPVQLGSIIIVGNGRIKVSDCGIGDGLQISSTTQNDIFLLGLVLLSLALKQVNVTFRNVNMLSRSYSKQLHMFIARLFFPPAEGGFADSNMLCHFLAPQIMKECDSRNTLVDRYEAELQKEIENGRILRLITKMNFINERPEYKMSPSWNESGDLYLLKLLNDYVFHRVDENGSPALDFGHIVDTLNKLDVGSPERIMLTSRDNQNVLVVTFADLKMVIDKAFIQCISERPLATY